MVSPRFLLARAALAGMFLALSGCSFVVKSDAEQCSVDADCAARGADFADTVCVEHTCQTKVDPKWGCIGHIDPPTAGTMVKVTIQLIDLVSTSPVTNATVKLCSKYDPPCASPLGAPAVDADGFVSATVASDFQGYFDIAGMGYVPSLAFIDVVVTSSNPQVQLVSPSAVATLAKGAKVEFDPTAGIVLSRTVDCLFAATAGVSVSIFPSDKQTGFYVIASGVSPGATATDSAGNAGFINVTPGTPTLTATRGPGGAEIGKVTTLVRAGAITSQILPPTSTL
jgi:hypothetical protein